MDSKIIFVGGKGGVGKSTIASSLACNLCTKDKKILLISTDPAHNLSDLFQIKLSNNITPLDKNLSVLEIDPKKEAQNYIKEISRNNKAFVSPNSYEMLDKYYQSAMENGITQESALFDKLINLTIDALDSWDHIIIDTAPTGHTLRLFTLANTLKTWNKTILKNQQKNIHLENILGTPQSDENLLNRLEMRYKKYTAFQNLLQDKKSCGIVFVLNPDFLSIEETNRAIQSLSKIDIKALAINKIAPLSKEDFFYNRYKIQEKYLEKINKIFKKYTKWYIPLLDKDILQKNQIQNLLEHIF